MFFSETVVIVHQASLLLKILEVLLQSIFFVLARQAAETAWHLFGKVPTQVKHVSSFIYLCDQHMW